MHSSSSEGESIDSGSAGINDDMENDSCCYPKRISQFEHILVTPFS